MRKSEQMKGQLTLAEQRQRNMPYGHGIGIAYYHTVLDDDRSAERTLKSLVRFAPDQYGADTELTNFYKSRGRMREARATIASAYERGGSEDTKTVVSFAGMMRAYGEVETALSALQGHSPSGDGIRTTSTLWEISSPRSANLMNQRCTSLSWSSSYLMFQISRWHWPMSCSRTKKDEAILLLQDSALAHTDSYTIDIGLAEVYSKLKGNKQCRQGDENAYDRGGKQSLPVLKQYTKALAENANASELSAVLDQYKGLWAEKKGYGHGITMGFFAGMAGLTTKAISIMNETIEAHPDKFDADLELAKYLRQ